MEATERPLFEFLIRVHDYTEDPDRKHYYQADSGEAYLVQAKNFGEAILLAEEARYASHVEMRKLLGAPDSSGFNTQVMYSIGSTHVTTTMVQICVDALKDSGGITVQNEIMLGLIRKSPRLRRDLLHFYANAEVGGSMDTQDVEAVQDAFAVYLLGVERWPLYGDKDTEVEKRFKDAVMSAYTAGIIGIEDPDLFK